MIISYCLFIYGILAKKYGRPIRGAAISLAIITMWFWHMGTQTQESEYRAKGYHYLSSGWYQFKEPPVLKGY